MSVVPPPKRHPYDQWAPDARALDLVGDKWTLLMVRDLAAGPRRFVELQRVLPGISTEQLRSRLNRMVADGLLTRQRYREVPPRVDYELTDGQKSIEDNFRIGATEEAAKPIAGLEVVAVPEKELLDNAKKWDDLYAEVTQGGTKS